MINLKTKHEIELMATAGRLLESVITEMKAACLPGTTTGDLDRLADRLIRRGGGRPGFLGYQDFPKSTCISVNDEVVHGIPGKRVIKSGDIVSLDLGLVLDGFWADMGCTVAVGQPVEVAGRDAGHAGGLHLGDDGVEQRARPRHQVDLVLGLEVDHATTPVVPAKAFRTRSRTWAMLPWPSISIEIPRRW